MTLAKSVSLLPKCSTIVEAAVIKNKKDLNELISNESKYNTVYVKSSDEVTSQTAGAVTIHDGVYAVKDVLAADRLLIQFNNSSPHRIRIRKGTALGSVKLLCDEDLNVQFIARNNISEQPTAGISSITVEDDVSADPIDHYLPLKTDDAPKKDIIQTIDLSKTAITKEQLALLIKVLEKYRDRFAEDPQNPSRTSLIKHQIHTGNHAPVRAQLKRFPPNEEEFIKNKIGEMLKNGIIIRSRSAWASRPALAVKQDGELRFCINYMALNRVTADDAY